MPQGEAREYLDAYIALKNPTSEGKGKKYLVKRKK